MSHIIKQTLLFLMLISTLQGCVSLKEMDVNVDNVLTNRNDNFGAFPVNYKAIIKADFNEIADVHHPEHLDFIIRRPVKFYSFNMSGTEIKWFSWVSEIAVPDKAIYLFGASDSKDWRTYYVRFTDQKLTHIYKMDDYTWLKDINGFEIEEKDGSRKIHRASERGAIVHGNQFIKFRHDLSPLPSDNKELAFDEKLLIAVQNNDINDALKYEGLGADPRRVENELCRIVPKYSSTVKYLYRWCGDEATGFITAAQTAARKSNLSMLRTLYAAGISPNQEVIWENPAGFDRAFAIGCFGLFNEDKDLLHDALMAGFNPHTECWGDPIVERISGQGQYCQKEACRKTYSDLAKELAAVGVTAKDQESWFDFDTAMKLAITAGTGALISTSDIDAYHGSDIFAATLKDLWMDEGGNNLAELNKRYQQGDFSIKDPSLAKMLAQQEQFEVQRKNAVKDLKQKQQLVQNNKKLQSATFQAPKLTTTKVASSQQQQLTTNSLTPKAAKVKKSTLQSYSADPVESLELQQMREVVRRFEESGVETPAVFVDLLEKMEEEEAKKASTSKGTASGKRLSEMSCNDDISGVWKTDSNLTSFDFKKNGQAVMVSNDATGQYYTKASVNWNATADTLSISYNYIRTYNSQTDELAYESKPKNETVSCEYMGTMLLIGGKVYSR